MTLQRLLGIELPTIDVDTIPVGPGRVPFSSEAADVLNEFKPAVVSFHFGLPSTELLARVRAWGSKIFSSATTVEEARWLEAQGVAISSGRTPYSNAQ
jgi:nitronate monooxygenase